MSRKLRDRGAGRRAIPAPTGRERDSGKSLARHDPGKIEHRGPEVAQRNRILYPNTGRDAAIATRIDMGKPSVREVRVAKSTSWKGMGR